MRSKSTFLILIVALLVIPGLLWAADRSPRGVKSSKIATSSSPTAAAAPASSSGVGNSPATNGNETVLEFKTMVGVDGPFLGSANPIRGVNGGGAPWVLDLAHGKLKANGDLDILVKGLVIPGVGNPVNPFRAIVSCLTVDEFGDVAEVNIITDPNDTQMIGPPRPEPPFFPNGDARIRAKINLPDPCVAPIIFVTSPGGSWFASTGAGVIPPPAP